MKKYLFFLFIPFLLHCTKDLEPNFQDSEFVEIRGEIFISERITFIEEDNESRFQLVFEAEGIDDLIVFRLGAHEFAFLESQVYEFDESRVEEMWLLGGNDCEQLDKFYAYKTYERFGGIQTLKFDPDELLWDCMIYAEPESITPLTFSIFVRKKKIE